MNAAAAAPAAAAEDGAAQQQHDAELLRLAQEFEVADREHWANYDARMGEITALDLPREEENAARTVVLRWSQTREPERERMLSAIAALPATTPEGLAAKAKVLRAMCGSWDVELPPFTATDALLSSVLRDCMDGRGA